MAASIDARPTNPVGYAYMSLGILVYGSMWPVFRIAVVSLPPLWFGTLRMWTASAFCVLLLVALGRFRLPSRQDWPAILSVGVFMMGLFVCVTHIGLQYVGAGRAALLAYTTPIWVTPIAVLVLKETMTRRKALGLLIAVAGLITLFNPFSFDWSNADVVRGNGLVLLAALSWSVTILHMRVHRWRLTPFQLAPYQLAVAGIITLVAALWLEPGQSVKWSAETALLVAYSGPFGSTLSMWAVTTAGRHLPATVLTVGMLGSPVLALILAAIFIGEPVTAPLVAGFVAILAGLLLVTTGNRARRTE